MALSPHVPKQTFLHFPSGLHSSSEPQSSSCKHSYDLHSFIGSPEKPLGQLQTALCPVARHTAFLPQELSRHVLTHSLDEHNMSSPQSLSVLHPGIQTP